MWTNSFAPPESIGAEALRHHMCGDDLDAEADSVEDARSSRTAEHFSMRTAGLKTGLQTTPCVAMQHRHHNSGGGVARLVEHPLVIAPTRSGSRVPILTGSTNTCSSDTVSTGFGRYVPYSEVAAVLGGEWLFLPVFGGLRVALRRSTLAGACAQSVANTIAESPGLYSYVLQGDTFVSSSLQAGDRYLLATTGAR
jgi:hypothetical protein